MVTKKKVVKRKSAKSVLQKNSTKMKDNSMLKYIQLAINTEKRGIKFYTAAKSAVDDYNMNRLMDVLLAQEHIHLKYMTDIYHAEKKKDDSKASKIAASYKAQPTLKNPLFGMRQLHDVAKKKSTIYHLFKQAIDFEDNGHDLYMDLARKIKDKKIANFLKMVAHEELKHRDFIKMHQEAIYDTGYWLGLEHTRLQT